MTDFEKTIWSEYWTQGKSGNQSYSIDKARMEPKLWFLWQAREYIQMALTRIDQGHEYDDLLHIENLLLAGLYRIRDSKCDPT